MRTLVFATNNPHKLSEIQDLLGDRFVLKSLADINCTEEIEETAPTLQGNALIKAKHVYDQYQHNCFADDTGLEVEALGGEPGVLSARYAGLARSSKDNMDLLMKNLAGQENRSAQFRTSICLIIDGKECYFEGIAKGKIAVQNAGHKGFGYDPIFIPEGEERTFAEMEKSEKNAISHRGKAFELLIEALKTMDK